jgi:release factor glutamine methyltransferase
VLCNPPYIRRDEIAGLMAEVARYEPGSALDGGVDGLDAYRVVLAALPALLAPGGITMFELGADQAEQVEGLAWKAGFVGQVRHDLAGHARVLMLQWPNA